MHLSLDSMTSPFLPLCTMQQKEGSHACTGMHRHAQADLVDKPTEVASTLCRLQLGEKT